MAKIFFWWSPLCYITKSLKETLAPIDTGEHSACVPLWSCFIKLPFLPRTEVLGLTSVYPPSKLQPLDWLNTSLEWNDLKIVATDSAGEAQVTTIILLSACWRMEVLGFSVFFFTPTHSVCIYPHPAPVDCFHPIILSVLFRALLSYNSTSLEQILSGFLLGSSRKLPWTNEGTKKACKKWSASMSDETIVAEVGAHVVLLHDAANMDNNNSALLL